MAELNPGAVWATPRSGESAGISFSVTALFFRSFYVTDVTVARNGCSCGSHALYMLQGCQAA